MFVEGFIQAQGRRKLPVTLSPLRLTHQVQDVVRAPVGKTGVRDTWRAWVRGRICSVCKLVGHVQGHGSAQTLDPVFSFLEICLEKIILTKGGKVC